MRIERIEGDVMKVNSFLVDAPDGLLLIDGQLTLTDAATVRRAIGATGVELTAAIVTHPHPDHYAGLAAIIGDADVPVYATAAVDEVMRRDDAIKHEIVGQLMGEEWPVQRRFADVHVVPGRVARLAGLDIDVVEIGPAESHVDTLWRLDTGDVFIGDLAYHDHHAYLADGHWKHWLAALTRLESELADDCVLHVGHGASGAVSLLAAQRRYVEEFVGAIESHRDAVDAGDHQPVVDAMRGLVTNDDLLFLMELSIAPVLATLTETAPSDDRPR
ncbi:N/A [soil metagenome]